MILKMFNNKKLYITGAGASKDLNSKNLLGSELLEQIKNHRFYIYYWLIAMVVVRVAKNLCTNFTLPDYKISKVIINFYLQNERIELNNGFKSPELINKFMGELLDNGFHAELYEKYLILKESEKFLLTDGRIFKEKFQFRNKNKEFEYFQTAIYHIVNFRITQYYEYENYKEQGMIQSYEFKDALDVILNYILAVNEDDSLVEIKEYFKQQIIHGITLSFIVENFSSDNNSIDNIINFLESLSFYSNVYAERYSLPKIEEIKNFAVLWVQDTIQVTSNPSMFRQERDYREYLNTKILSKKEEELQHIDKNIDFINFNYDLSLFGFFKQQLNGYFIGLEDRKKALENLTKKIEESHIYGRIDGAYLSDLDSSFLLFFTKLLKFIRDDNYDEIINKIKERQNTKISLIRTQPSPDKITANFTKIENSDEIYILGFSFDEYNLQNIGIYTNDNLEKITKKTVYATNYGDLPRIRLALERIFAVKLYKESELQEDGKKHSFWRSRDGATNKRNNNVFVSTKPVYRALTEDFLV